MMMMALIIMMMIESFFCVAVVVFLLKFTLSDKVVENWLTVFRAHAINLCDECGKMIFCCMCRTPSTVTNVQGL